MGFFDFFRKKKETNLEELVGSIMTQVFPNGRQQIQGIASSLYRDFNGKYPQDTLMKSIAYCGSLLITAQDKSANRVVDMGLMMKPDNVYSRTDATKIYKSVVKSYFTSKIGLDNKDAFEAFYKSLGNIDDSVEIVNNRIKGAYGTYGLSVNNPIPVKGIQTSYTFLDNLLTNTGEEIIYKRLGSFSSNITKELIDGYAITSKSGKSLGTIYICGYCNVDKPEPPLGFIIKGMPIKQNSAPPVSPSPRPASSISATYSPRPNIGSVSKVIPTLINPKGMDVLLKRAKRADLAKEINSVFEKNGIQVSYSGKYDIHKIHDVFNDYQKFLKSNPIYESYKSDNHSKYILGNFQHFFKIGIAAYLVHNEYGEYIGRWSEDQYNLFLDSLKSKSFFIYFDMLDSFDNCTDDLTKFEKCFSETSNQIYREYGEECITEISSICRVAYYTGFRYSLIKFGDEFLRSGLSEKDYGSFRLSQNLCNALSYAYHNGKIENEEFLFEEDIASQSKQVSMRMLKYYNETLCNDKSFYDAFSKSVCSCIYCGVDAVLMQLHSNISSYLTDKKIQELAKSKDYIATHPGLKKSDITQLQCEIANGSNILNVKDNSLKIAKMEDLAVDAFLLGMTIALNLKRTNSI